MGARSRLHSSNCVCGSTVNSWLRGKSKATTQQTDHCLDSHAHGSWCCPNPRKFSSSLRIPFSGVRKSETRALRYERSSAWSSPTRRSRPCHWPASLKPVLRRPPNQRPGRAGGSCARGSRRLESDVQRRFRRTVAARGVDRHPDGSPTHFVSIGLYARHRRVGDVCVAIPCT